jgi:hypothetical protein
VLNNGNDVLRPVDGSCYLRRRPSCLGPAVDAPRQGVWLWYAPALLVAGEPGEGHAVIGLLPA